MSFARDGIQFRNAWSQCPLTLPSHLSIFTGLLPPRHGVRDNLGYRFDSAAHPTIASLLRGRGYQTGAAVSAYVLRGASGAAAGFDDYDDAVGIVDGAPVGALQRSGAVSEKIAERWIDAHTGRPFFYFLHLYEPHTPYEPTYDSDVRRADALAGDLLAFLKRRNLYDGALVIILADHGEGLGDHGEAEHGVFLYREDLQVPLLVKPPRFRSPAVVDRPVMLTDVFPTVAAAVDIEAPQNDGRNLLDASTSPRSLYSESLYPRIHLGWSDLRSLIKAGLHVIDAPAVEVYDMSRDAAERKNIAQGERRAAADARGEASRIGGAYAQPAQADREEAKKFAALGYVSAGTRTDGPLPDPKTRIQDLAALKEIASSHEKGGGAERLARMERLLTANPLWSDLRDELGQGYDSAGEHKRAAQTYEEGIRLTPSLASQFALSAASSLAEAGELDAAAAHAHLAERDNGPAAHLLLGEIALARGDLEAATHEAAGAGTTTQMAHARFLEARIAVRRRDFVRSLQLLSDVQADARTTGESLPRHFHAVAGDVLAETGKAGDAAIELERALVEDPRDVESYVNLAFLEAAEGQRELAEGTIERLRALRPDRATCLVAARVLERLGDPAGAARWRGLAARAK
jgi:choline-sulfatase